MSSKEKFVWKPEDVEVTPGDGPVLFDFNDEQETSEDKKNSITKETEE